MDDQQKNGWMKKLDGWECCQFTTCKWPLFRNYLDAIFNSKYLSIPWAPFFWYISVSYWLIEGASQVQLFFFFLQWVDWLTPKKSWNYGGSPKQKILWKDGVPPPLAHLYRWEGEDFGQNIWDWSEVLLGTYWELREHTKNLMTTN